MFIQRQHIVYIYARDAHTVPNIFGRQLINMLPLGTSKSPKAPLNFRMLAQLLAESNILNIFHHFILEYGIIKFMFTST